MGLAVIAAVVKFKLDPLMSQIATSKKLQWYSSDGI